MGGSRARVAKLADALDSGSSGRKVVQVQILSRAPFDSSAVVDSLMASRLAKAYGGARVGHLNRVECGSASPFLRSKL